MRTRKIALIAIALTSAATFEVGLASGALTNNRAFVAGRYELELDGATSGAVLDVAGGSPIAEVVSEKLGADHVAKKHIGAVKYEDITVHVGTGMSQGFYQWITDTLAHKVSRKSGATIALDYNSRELSRTTFSNALLTEVEIPGLDAASKDAGKLSVTFTPEFTRLARAATQGKAVSSHEDMAKTKKWMVANFRLKIDGLDAAMPYVVKVDPFKMKMKTSAQAVGEFRDYQVEPTTLEYSSLVVTLPENRADVFYKWHDDFLIKGNSADDKEKGGTLELLSPNLQTVYFTISFKHLGIFRIEADKADSNSETARKVRVHMYVEDASFAFGTDAKF